MAEYVRGKGGEVRTGVRLQRIELDSSSRVAGFRLSDGSLETADLYVSAMPGAAMQQTRLLLDDLVFSGGSYSI